jgi:hypothetical protein
MKVASQWTYELLVWFGRSAKPNQYIKLRYGTVRMPTRDNWIVEGSTVFTKAQAVYVDQIMKTLRQCCKIEGNSSHGESATMAGLYRQYLRAACLYTSTYSMFGLHCHFHLP